MKHFKVSNIRLIKKRLIIYTSVTVASFCFYFFYTQGFNNFDIKSLTLLLIIIAIFSILIIRTKYFEFDSSGEVISLRSYHLFSKKERKSEFPKTILQQYQLKKSDLGTVYLKFFIVSTGSRKITIRYKLSPCSQSAFLQIKKSLEYLDRTNEQL